MIPRSCWQKGRTAKGEASLMLQLYHFQQSPESDVSLQKALGISPIPMANRIEIGSNCRLLHRGCDSLHQWFFIFHLLFTGLTVGNGGGGEWEITLYGQAPITLSVDGHRREHTKLLQFKKTHTEIIMMQVYLLSHQDYSTNSLAWCFYHMPINIPVFAYTLSSFDWIDIFMLKLYCIIWTDLHNTFHVQERLLLLEYRIFYLRNVSSFVTKYRPSTGKSVLHSILILPIFHPPSRKATSGYLIIYSKSNVMFYTVNNMWIKHSLKS